MNNDQTLIKIETILYSSVSDAEKRLRIKSIINENHLLIFKTINELIDYDFIVPSYQRGYKWKEQQVKDLLSDIQEFADSKTSDHQFYCLQPIIAKRAGGKWNIIDGQQRLTTIYLILKYLDHKPFGLEYNTRDKSKEFLQNLNKDSFGIEAADDTVANIDIHHFKIARTAIIDWFKGKDCVFKKRWRDTLLKNTQIIWYTPKTILKQQSEIDIFSRINSGKIPLTNSELIRALFIHHSKKSKNPEAALLQQNKIASEWDYIEQQLHDEDFWCFISLGFSFSKKEYPNRIEFLFDLIEHQKIKESKKNAEKDKKTDDKYSTFRMYNDQILSLSDKKEGKVHTLWQEIKNFYYRFHEWYIDRDLYHLTGYARLVSIGLTTTELLDLADKKKQSDLIKHIKNKIWKEVFKNSIKNKINGIDKNDGRKQESVKYGDKDIRKILLLFNVALATKDEYMARFNFRSYTKNNKWDIEHIRSQTLSGEEAKIWLKAVKDKVLILPEAVINSLNSLSNDELRDLTKRVHKELEKGTSSDDEIINDLGNLCLLDEGTNRGYGNAIFTDKRKIIIERIENGQFVPQGTQNVFLKVYSNDLSEMELWKESDAKNYQAKIIKTISAFLGGE